MKNIKWVRRVVLCLIAADLLIICAVVFRFDIYAGGDDTMRGRAHFACGLLAQASEAYRDDPANPKHELPRTLNDLCQPPWGGPGFLKRGLADLHDPWGGPYQLEHRKTTDGRDYVLISTTAPDGTRISQFGFGRNAEPRW